MVNKFVIIIPLILTVLLSGCLEEEIEENLMVLVENGNNYYQGDPLEGLNFRIPDEINTNMGIIISFEIIRPDDTTSGVYTDTFYPPITSDVFMDTYAVILYYDGMWNVNYDIYEGYDDSNKTHILTGKGRFFVVSNDSTLADFDVIYFETEQVGETNEVFVNFTVKNTGREPGRVYLSFYNNELKKNDTVYEMGHEYWYEDRHIQDDEEIHHSEQIFLTGENMDITLKYNDEEHSQRIILGDIVPEPEDYTIFYTIILALIFLIVYVAVRKRW